MTFVIQQVQVALFFTSVVRNRIRIASIVTEKIAGLQTAELVAPPVSEMPVSELPDVILQSPATGWGFQFSPVRCDFVYSPIESAPVRELQEMLQSLGNDVASVWTEFRAKLSATGNRVGIIVTVADRDLNGAETLFQRELSRSEDPAPKEVQLHQLYTPIDEDVSFNHWIRLLGRPDGLLILNDVNTMPEAPIDITTATLDRVIASATKLTVEAVRKYGE